MVRVSLSLMLALSAFCLGALAQTTSPGPAKKGKDSDSGKLKAKDTGKAKPAEKGESGKDISKLKFPLDKIKTPGGAIIIVVDDLLKAAELMPKYYLLTPELFQKLTDQAPEKQPKVEKKLPSVCKLHGRLEGDYLAVRAEFLFATEQPKTTVFLGLLAGHLMDEGDLDRQMANLDVTKEGFVVRVAKEGNHQLTLNLRVRVDAKKSASGGNERGLDLGLPGAAVTTLQLELPGSVKELRWNENLEKTKTPGRWLLGLKSSESLSLSWKEPIALTGNSPLAKVEGQVNVRVDETHVNIKAELFLEDLRFQTKEWNFLLPPSAKVEVKPPAGLTYQWSAPEGKNAYYTLRLPEATSERWQVSVDVHVPRPNPGVRVPIGPFLVLGAYQQQGTISVQMPVEQSLGQRLVFHRQGEIYPLKSSESESTFQYVVPPLTEKKPKLLQTYKMPLELEWRYEKNQVETHTDHALKIKTVPQGWEMEATTQIKVKTLFAGINSVDIRLPTPRPRGTSLVLSAAPGMGFPAAAPWGALWHFHGVPLAEASPEETTVSDVLGNPLKLAPQDALGKTRVVWERGPAKDFALVVRSVVRIPLQNRRIHLELPRPINTQDRGGNVAVQTDDRIELLQGSAEGEVPVPQRHHFVWNWDQAPAGVDLAWRFYRRETVAQAVVDVLLHEHTAQVRQELSFPRDNSAAPGGDARQTQIRLHVPRRIDKVTMISGGKITNQDLQNQALWFQPNPMTGEKVDIVLEYDLLPNKKAMGEDLRIPFIWPAHVSRKDAKVRVWSETGGVKIRLAEELFSRGVWKERSVEVVPKKDHFPALVLQGDDVQLPLTLGIEDSAPAPLAAILAERGLVQVTMNDDGSQHCRARFFVKKINARHLDVELPIPAQRLRDRPTFMMGEFHITDWKSLDATGNTLRLPLHSELTKLPAVLEIAFTIPPEYMERTGLWRTELHPPVFRSEIAVGKLRWQLSLPAPMIAATLSKPARVETHWSVQGWLLTPGPAATGADAESWLTGKEGGQPAPPVTFAFSAARLQPYVIYHLAREVWLLGCSGLFLVVTLAGYFSPLPRIVVWLFLLALAAGALVLGMMYPGALPPLLFGCQPGLVLLVLFVGIHRFWQERSRRRMVFLPVFARTKPSSTMVRTGSSKRPREASTVDSPAAAADAGPKPSSSGTPAGS